MGLNLVHSDGKKGTKHCHLPLMALAIGSNPLVSMVVVAHLHKDIYMWVVIHGSGPPWPVPEVMRVQCTVPLGNRQRTWQTDTPF